MSEDDTKANGEYERTRQPIVDTDLNNSDLDSLINEIKIVMMLTQIHLPYLTVPNTERYIQKYKRRIKLLTHGGRDQLYWELCRGFETKVSARHILDRMLQTFLLCVAIGDESKARYAALELVAAMFEILRREDLLMRIRKH